MSNKIPRSSMPRVGARVTSLTCQIAPGVLAARRDPIHLSWQIASPIPGDEQAAYEIQVSDSQTFEPLTAVSGVVAGRDQIHVVAPGPRLKSREVRFYHVRVESKGGWTEWSPTLRVEAGLLEPDDWRGLAITAADDEGSEHAAPSPLLRRAFDLPARAVSARLYVTCHGVFRATINGRAVAEDLLSPGWTTYRHRVLAETYDVTGLLVPGPNVIGLTLADGWFRGRLGWDPTADRGRYGSQLGVLVQLEVTTADRQETVIASDTTWKASVGEIRSADLYDGCLIDLRHAQAHWDEAGFDDQRWRPVVAVDFDRTTIEPRIAPPVRVIDTIPVVPISGDDGRLHLDGGQNIAGFVRLTVRGRTGQPVTVRHAEVLEPDGSLHTRSLRSAKATDTYVLADDAEVVLEPAFTFHGFRYAEIETPAEVIEATYVAISTANPRRAEFACSDPALNKLHENVVWSQQDNFVSVPTDCPQRDERLGWTGDAQAFAPTASTLFDSLAFWSSWLRDLALDQSTELGVSTVVPDVVLDGEPRFGRAGWADAATIVPWSVYVSYGDTETLRRQYASMRGWVESLIRRQGPDGLLPEAMQFGDWLDPDAPSDRPWLAKADSTYLANAFFAHSARLLARTARVLGDATVATTYEEVGSRVAAATWRRWADDVVLTQTGCAVALSFEIVPEDQRATVGEALARLVRDADGRVSTGFLGTPLVLVRSARPGTWTRRT